jgi:adiponectin receptor
MGIIYSVCNTSNMLSKHQAPIYSHEPYILCGYRPKLDFMECIKSIFSIHNQTVNIWTSIALMLYNIWLTVHYTFIHPDMPTDIFVVFWMQGFLRAYCWFNSGMYHTFVCHSTSVSNLCCNMDYIGCYLTPLGIGTNLMFLEFYCNPEYKLLFISVGSMACLVTIYLSLLEEYSKEKYRYFRMICSACSGLPWLVGLCVSIIVVHFKTTPRYYSYFLYGIICECIAGVFYVTMFPERAYPRVFDIWLSSHSIWHWLNFGFDTMMLKISHEAYLELMETNRCVSR